MTVCDPMDCSTPGSPVLHYLMEFAQTHACWVCDAIQPSHPLLPLLLLPSVFPRIRVFSSELALRIRWPQYWSFSISPSSEYSGLIFFRMDWLDLLTVQGTDCQESSLAPHFESISFSALHQFFFMIQFSHPYMTTRKTIALTMVFNTLLLLFEMLSRLVIAFLPRSKHLLISWLQSQSAVIGAQQKKVCHYFHCFPIYLPWSDGTKCHDLSFLNVEL